MSRNVAELLPRAFAELTLDDVAQILANVGEERESLFFERKASVNGNALAKACSAFANTYGGLLVVGVADDDDTLVGIPPLAAEAQLWVKDTLRSLVLPMPPFRARWLPTEGERGILLVLHTKEISPTRSPLSSPSIRARGGTSPRHTDGWFHRLTMCRGHLTKKWASDAGNYHLKSKPSFSNVRDGSSRAGWSRPLGC